MESFENIASTIRTFRLEQQSAIGGIPDSFQQTLNETQRQAMNNINAMNQQMADWMIQAASPLNTIEVLQSEILELRAALQSQRKRCAGCQWFHFLRNRVRQSEVQRIRPAGNQ